MTSYKYLFHVCIVCIFLMVGIIRHILVEYRSSNYTPRLDQVVIRNRSSAKRIILWNKNFGSDNWGLVPKGSLDHNITCTSNHKCVLSIDRTNPLDGDVLVFHMVTSHTIPQKRLPHQIYLMYGHEPPSYRRNYFVKGGKFYNWTATYTKRSDVKLLHGTWSKLPKRSINAIKSLPQLNKTRLNGTATIAWVVSNCVTKSHRDDYVKELKRHIPVDVFGNCGMPCPKGAKKGTGVQCFNVLSEMGQHKFYLAFENSACEDYVSLKPYRALMGNMVPVVLGGKSNVDFVGVFPPNAYIDVRNFTTPKRLAKYLDFLDKNDDKYLAYHAWRIDYSAVEWGTDDMCQICDAVHNLTMTKTHRNVDWGSFWNESAMCDAQLVPQLLARKD